MKKLLLSFLLFIVSETVFCQSGGPDTFGYIWRGTGHAQGPAYNWIDITTAPGAIQVTGLADDNTSGFIPIGFQFPYYWYDVSQFKIGSNGYIIFEDGAVSSPFPAMPSSALPNDLVAPFMCDLNFAGAGNTAQCWYWSNLTDSLVVSYINVPFWRNAATPYSGSNTFQVILSKVDSSVTFQYSSRTDTSTGTGNFLSIGIENISGTIGLQQSLNTYQANSSAVKFYYPAANPFIVNDASTVYNNNPSTGGLFLSKDGNPFTMTAQIANTGNQPLSPFTVNMSVVNSSNVVQVQQTLASSALTSGQTENLTSANTFSPSIAGIYKFNTSTQLAGDATGSNNSKTLELRVVDTTQTFMTLTYTGDSAAPKTAGQSWSDGHSGAGVEFVPPFYPCYLSAAEFYIGANASAAGFASLIYDNSGPSNGPGLLLDSVYRPAAQVLAPNRWNRVHTTAPILINSGSVFIEWLMDGTGIRIGTDTTAPISNRTYEILGGWSIFRYRENRDLMIRAIISSSQLSVGIENLKSSLVGEFYPSPSNGKVFLECDLADATLETKFNFYNLQGQLMKIKQGSHHPGSKQEVFSFDMSNLVPGLYICEIIHGDRVYKRKLIIGH